MEHSNRTERETSAHGQSSLVTAPITFGVEIEAVLAFTQQRLQSVLDTYYQGLPKIIKAFPDSAHDTFLGEEDLSHRCRNLYPSWVLQVPIEADLDRSLQLVAHQSTSITGRSGKARRYLAEPLIIAREAIKQTDIPIDIRAQLRRAASTVTLSEEGPSNSVILQTQSANYDRWTLTTDHTLIGCVNDQLHKIVGDSLFEQSSVHDPDGTIRTVQEKKWDSAGFELVSPVFRYDEKAAAFTSISQCLNQLSNEPHYTLNTASDERQSAINQASTQAQHTITSSVWASLQVHIGLDINDTNNNSLPLLQHLAYILLCHEDLLSKLHPRSRCGLPLKKASVEDQTSVNENWDEYDDFEGFDPDAPLPPEKTPAEIAAEDELYLRQNDEMVLAAEAKYTGYNTTNSNVRYFCQATSSAYPPTSTHIASHVFRPGMSLLDLVSLLQRPSDKSSDAIQGHRYRGYMYNFDNILTMNLEDQNSWKTGKPTIEFRQHACSVDSEEVRRWVELCYAIVRLAQKMAEKEVSTDCGEGEEELRKYQSGQQWPCGKIEDFLGEAFVGLQQDDIQYWIGRYEKYREDRPTEEEVDHAAI